MIRTAPSLIAAALMAFAAGAMPATVSRAAQTVGVTSAVNAASLGAGKPLSVGAAVIHNEHIDTNSSGSVQLLFLDRTTMVVGPNSNVVIDDYVYDTRKQTGRMAITVTKGLLRFVGGQIAHKGEATARTPTAVVGIRGGTAQLSVNRKGTLAIFLGANQANGWLNVARWVHGGRLPGGFGSVTPQQISRLPGAVRIVRAGFATQIGFGGGSSLPSPRRIDLATLNQMNALLTSRPGSKQTGGVAVGVSKNVAVVARGSAGTVASNTILPSTPPVGGNPTGSLNGAQVLPSSSASIGTLNQTKAVNELKADRSEPAVFALSMTNCCAPMDQTSQVPYLPSAFAFNANAAVTSPVLGFRPANSDYAVTLQYGFGFNGTGKGQSSWLYVATGAFLPNDQGGVVWTGGFMGTRRAGSNYHSGSAGFDFSSPAGAVKVDPVTGLPLSGQVDQNAFHPAFTPPAYADAVKYLSDLASLFPGRYLFDPYTISHTATELAGLPPTPASYQPGLASYYPGTAMRNDLLGATQDYRFTQDFSATATPDGLGGYRPTVVLSGKAAAIAEASSGQYMAPTIISGPALIYLDGQNGQVLAGLDYAVMGSTASLPQLGRGTGAYIDYNHFGARNGGVSGNIRWNGAFVSVSPDEAKQIADQLTGKQNAVSFCQCDYTRWGFWSEQDVGYGVAYSVPMGLWVAGRPTTAAEVPTSGTATYTGHAIADIANGTSQYVAAGNFSNTVDFAARTGTVTVNQLDGVDYAGRTAINRNDPTTFAGQLNGGGRTMLLDGSFYRGKASPVGEMGGQLTISGQDYKGAGIFAAKAQ